MRLSHTHPVRSASCDDPNLLAAAGVVPVMALAERASLSELAREHLSVPTDKGAHPDRKMFSLVAGMVAGADSIDDMAVLRHGAMGKVFDHPYAPSTLGSFLREFRFGHVRQADAIATRLLAGLARHTPVLAGIDGPVMIDIDDSIIEVHGPAKQGVGFGYTRVRGLNSAITTLTCGDGAPVIAAQRLRKGACNSARGAHRLIADTLATVRRLRSSDASGPILLRADSAFYGHRAITTALRAGAQVSVTVRQDSHVRAAISEIPADAWTPIEYTDAVFDEDSGQWVSRAEVAEVPFTAFTSKAKRLQVSGRLVVRRIPDFAAEGDGLFDVWRFHAFFTTSDLDTVTADKTHRGHAIIEQVHADLKASALAHLPSGKFCANAAWLVCAVIAFNLTRAAACLGGQRLAKATTSTIRRTLICIPARIASSARRITMHLPARWPWEREWNLLFNNTIKRQHSA
ncbi:transposase IS4 family protein [Gordonia bronchialis DSM 43247]|uniref:Transposase IS4 family protein n=1 Tax=Gordonia bronchialis (strain ATCC 25592 / DSM 43247 / BCRC 13721 / JCM 3198 / KCTC 3076 / NBRC 16047 / NCTC 10667) TaxID=526226 RepID=D0L304_GORB4|nr:IS1380-like element ISGbr1 family transposase [Gordonia bronchialis]ACY20129.1 transposase IS4 family protein [Gordonia bronchialis DSM 43247]ACY23821.1 transposase IS4 family protein [Gordonia bronchialis DSM 43247]MCC3321988.1 IS1380-like element ISGbr1 family transposase [Gordonia bronchialis]MCC3322901.1 IS1380-like element ISGbr1 family transposase [Gordonia bronchialis]MCC3323780.1 IS1380-like element ISGbr1 family transposase [Gordonia bronchialis]